MRIIIEIPEKLQAKIGAKQIVIETNGMSNTDKWGEFTVIARDIEVIK